VLFSLGITVRGLLHSDYNQVTELVSSVVIFQNGWIRNATFITVGYAMLLFAPGLVRASLHGAGSRIGPLPGRPAWQDVLSA
jgi:hypothetical protein